MDVDGKVIIQMIFVPKQVLEQLWLNNKVYNAVRKCKWKENYMNKIIKDELDAYDDISNRSDR